MERYPMEGFAERLRELWFASELTQEEAAFRIGVSREVFSAYIYENVMPNALHIARMCLVFRASADYLLFGKGSENSGTEGK